MVSSRLTAARHVRTVASLRSTSSIAASMRGLVSLMTSFSLMNELRKVWPAVAMNCAQDEGAGRHRKPLVVNRQNSGSSQAFNEPGDLFAGVADRRSDPRPAGDNAGDISLLAHVEDYDGEVIVHTKRDRRSIHYLGLFFQTFDEVNAFEPGCAGINHWIRGIDSVDLGGFQNYVRFDLCRAQRRRGIGREKRISGSGSKNHDSPFLQVANRPTSNERFC